jgi:hypothetical protein
VWPGVRFGEGSSAKVAKRKSNSAFQSAAVPSDIDLERLGEAGGAIQRRLSPIRCAARWQPDQMDVEIVEAEFGNAAHCVGIIDILNSQ